MSRYGGDRDCGYFEDSGGSGGAVQVMVETEVVVEAVWRASSLVRIDLKQFEKNFYKAASASRNLGQRLAEQFRYGWLTTLVFLYNFDKMIFPINFFETKPHPFQNHDLINGGI